MAKEFSKSFYKSNVWRAARRRALMRDGYSCQICGARATEVHHVIELTPENISDVKVSLNLNNLQSLCHDCHREITMEEHGMNRNDAGVGYWFDSEGNLQKYPGGKPPG